MGNSEWDMKWIDEEQYPFNALVAKCILFVDESSNPKLNQLINAIEEYAAYLARLQLDQTILLKNKILLEEIFELAMKLGSEVNPTPEHFEEFERLRNDINNLTSLIQDDKNNNPSYDCLKLNCLAGCVGVALWWTGFGLLGALAIVAFNLFYQLIKPDNVDLQDAINDFLKDKFPLETSSIHTISSPINTKMEESTALTVDKDSVWEEPNTLIDLFGP